MNGKWLLRRKYIEPDESWGTEHLAALEKKATEGVRDRRLTSAERDPRCDGEV